MFFTKKKFLNLPKEHQHRKLSQILRKIWEAYPKHEELYNHYKELCDYAEIPFTPLSSYEQISNNYHNHLRQGNLSLKEHNLLQQIDQNDRKEALPLLPVNIYLDHIRSSHNIGSIIRTTEAFRLGKLYFCEQTANTKNKQVQKTSMGTHDWLESTPMTSLENLAKPLISLETSSVSIPLKEFIFPKEFTLILGNEEYGVSEKALRASDYCVRIPLCGRKNSLNVANAFAITAQEIHYQLREKKTLEE
jgi:tRNA G18 (ribose-2'-O)-methylase SpoU